MGKKTQNIHHKPEEHKELLNILAEQTRQLVYHFDIASGDMIWQGAISSVTGYTERYFNTHFNSGRWRQHLHPDEQKQVVAKLEKSIAQNKDFEATYRFKIKGGKYIWIEEHGAIIEEDGRKIMIGSMHDITERKNLLQKFKVTSDRYQTIFDSLNDGVFIHDASTGKILEVNQKVIEMFGYDRHEIVGETIGKFSDRDEGYTDKEAQKRIKKAMEKDQRFEWKNISQDGQEIWVDVSLRPSEVKGEKIVIAVVRDITERKKAREEIQKNEEKFKNIFKNSVVGLSLTDKTYTIVEVNQALADMLGYEKNELEGKKVEELSEEKEFAKDVEKAKQLEAREIDSYTLEKQLQKKNGESIYVLLHVIRNENPDQPYAYITQVVDITERRLNEKALEEREQELSLLTDNVRDMISRHDEDGRFLYVSPSSKEVVGYASKELLGQPSLKFNHPDDISKIEQKLQELLEKGSGEKIEYRFKQKDGTFVWVESNLTVTKEDGEMNIIASTRNVEERKRAEKELEKRNVELETMNDLMIERELKMVKMKEKLKELKESKSSKDE